MAPTTVLPVLPTPLMEMAETARQQAPVRAAAQARHAAGLDDPVDLGAAPDDHEEGDGHRLKALGQPLVDVDVHLDDLQPTRVGARELFEDRRDHPAGATPGSPKSTTTGTDAVISSVNDASSALTTHGNAVLQFAHRGVPEGIARPGCAHRSSCR